MSQTEHCKEQISLDIWPLVKFEVDFCLIDSLGEGSFGKVYLVQCVNWGKIGMKYAAKHSRCPKAKDKLRVREEIEILSDLRGHNNVVEIIVAYEGPELIIQVHEYLSGGCLFEEINNKLPLLESECSSIIRQICVGIEYISSKNIAHLDIKPENLVYKADRKTLSLVDFGFAKRIDRCSRSVKSGQGTPEFVSPEVLKSEPITKTTDLWSCGVVAYILLSSLSPFLGDCTGDTFENIKNCDYRFDEPQFSNVSNLAIEFVRSLLLLRPEDRMTPTEAISHSWVKRCSELSQ